jgi:hypothetical protein
MAAGVAEAPRPERLAGIEADEGADVSEVPARP